MEDYENMLDSAYKNVKVIEKSDRFQIPEIKLIMEGNKTIVSNFSQVAGHLRRKPEHLLKYLLRELAVAGIIEGDRLVLQRKVPKQRIEEKIKSYVEEFVRCKECKKPDTELIKQDNFNFLHCFACGAKYSLRKI